jgi:hypothetical protein
MVTIRAPSVTDPRRAGLVRPGWNHRRPDHSGVRPADPTRNRQPVLRCPPQAKESELHLLPPPRTRPRAVDVLTGLPPVAASDQHLWDALTRARVNGWRRPDGRGFAASACAAIGSQLRRLPTLRTDQGRYHPSGRQHPHRRQRSAADREFTDALIVQDGGRPCVVNSCEGSHLPSCRPSGLGQAKPSGLGQAKLRRLARRPAERQDQSGRRPARPRIRPARAISSVPSAPSATGGTARRCRPDRPTR